MEYTEYTVISEQTLEKLIAKVNEHLRDGGHLQGGVSAQMGWTFNQAMAR